MHRDESRSLFGAWAGAIFPLLPLTKRRDEEFSLHPDNSIVFQRFAGKAFPAVKARTCPCLLCHAIHKLLEFVSLVCMQRTTVWDDIPVSIQKPLAWSHGESSLEQKKGCCLTLPRMNDGGFFLQPARLPALGCRERVEVDCPEAFCTLCGVPVSVCPTVR